MEMSSEETPFFIPFCRPSRYAPTRRLGSTATATWATLHTIQYDIPIMGPSGISEARTCASAPVREDLVDPVKSGWLKLCVPISEGLLSAFSLLSTNFMLYQP